MQTLKNIKRQKWMIVLLAFCFVLSISLFPIETKAQTKRRPQTRTKQSRQTIRKLVVKRTTRINLKRPVEADFNPAESPESPLLPASSTTFADFTNQAVRLELKVQRGDEELSLMGVPRLEKGDVVKVKVINSTESNFSPNFDWRLIVAFTNPNEPLVKNIMLPKERNTQEEEAKLVVQRDGRRELVTSELIFDSPATYDSVPIIFLVPKGGYRKEIFEMFKKGNADDVTKLGKAMVELSGGLSKMQRFLDATARILSTPAATGENFDFLISRLEERFGLKLPEGWKTPNGRVNASNSEKFDFIRRNMGLAQYEKVVTELLQKDFRVDREGLLSDAVALAKRNFPTISPYIDLAVAAITIIKKFFFARDPLVLLPALVRPLPSAEMTNYNQQFSDGVALWLNSAIRNNVSVTGIPIVPHLWKSDDQNEIVINAPTVNCLRTGVNQIRNEDAAGRWAADTFTRDFTLNLNGVDVAAKRLRKNVGLDLWELDLTQDDINRLRTAHEVRASISGKRGFSSIKTNQSFRVNVVKEINWSIDDNSRLQFYKTNDLREARKKIILRPKGDNDCLCLVSVKFFPAGGGSSLEFIRKDLNKPEASEFDLIIAPDKKSAEFTINTALPGILEGEGRLEIRQFGEDNSPKTETIKLYPQPPQINDFVFRAGDRQGLLTGDRLDQISKITVNDKEITISNQGRTATTITAIYPDSVGNEDVPQQPGMELNLQITLKDDRRLSALYPDKTLKFPVLKSRPKLAANERTENGVKLLEIPAEPVPLAELELNDTPVLPLSAEEVLIPIESAIDDYVLNSNENPPNFKWRIEGSAGEIQIVDARLETSDDSPKIVFPLNANLRTRLKGKRLQFRLVDVERGESDWYTIENVFVRVPDIVQIDCNSETTQPCKLSGTNLRSQISSISVDGGQTWQNISVAGVSLVSITPRLVDNKMFWVKLRDYPKQGFRVPETEFVFVPPPPVVDPPADILTERITQTRNR